jgi:hypothetical protein
MAQKEYSFDDLPIDKSGPFYNAWGRFGEKDQLGTLNFLTPEKVQEAAKEIKTGTRVSLDWDLDRPHFPNFGRQRFFHHVHHKAPRTVNDDMIVFNTQCSSQWDGFRHFGHYTCPCSSLIIFTDGLQATLRQRSTTAGIPKTTST